MNAIEMLTRQHREMEKTLKQMVDGGPAIRAAKFARAADVLMSHILVEERCFYPAVKARRTEDILLESLEEHLSLKRLVADLVAMPTNDSGFEAKLVVLEEQAKHHHEEEEDNLFPKVAKLMTDEELARLGSEMGTMQARLLTQEPRALAGQQTAAAASLR